MKSNPLVQALRAYETGSPEQDTPARRVKDPGVAKGYTDVSCPVARCNRSHKFVDTEQTLKSPAATQAARRNFLLRAHEAGRHRNL